MTSKDKVRSVSRRALIAGAAALPLAAGSIAGAAAEPGMRAARGAPILIKGGTIVSMDEAVGDLDHADILISGTKIIDIGRDLKAPGAHVIAATGMIVMPGFVDAHRHAWQSQLRRINPNAKTLSEYAAATHLSFAKYYRPLDMYVGNLVTALSCIDAGITCMVDNSHNSRSAAHSDMAIRALVDAGIRAVHASGRPAVGDWDHQWPRDLERLKDSVARAPDELVTLGLLAPLDGELWRLARRHGLRIYTELLSRQRGQALDELASAKMVGPDNTFNHCGDLADSTWAYLRESGAAINVCPRSDSQYGLGYGFPAYQAALDNGLKPGFSIDNETSYGGDMFTEMRVAFHIQRAVATNRKLMGDAQSPAPVLVRDVLSCATVNGAACAGLSGKIGKLAKGMEADIVMIRTDSIDLYPSNNAIATIVGAADRRSVDTVLIAGKIRKRKGELVGVDIKRVRSLVDESRRHIFSSADYTPDIFADRLNLP